MTPPPRSLDVARLAHSTHLRDGSAVRVRPLRAGEESALREFLESVSADSLYSRFFGTPSVDRAAASLADCSHPGDVALVVEAGVRPSIVAHAGAFTVGQGRAEVAFLVADEWQGRGLGSLLLSRLALAARQRGVPTLVADVLPRNGSMLAVFQRSGYPVQTRPGAHEVRVLIGTTPLAADDVLAA